MFISRAAAAAAGVQAQDVCSDLWNDKVFG